MRLTLPLRPASLFDSDIMKKSLILPLLLATATTGFGQLYFGAGAAYFFPEAEYDIQGTDLDANDHVGGIANIGYKIPSNGWHFEFEFQYTRPDAEGTSPAGKVDVDADNYAYFGNVYYDILATMETNWGIYVGGGLGAVDLQQSVTVTGPNGSVSDDDGDLMFAYQGLAGISYLPLENLRFDLAYRYTATDGGSVSVFGSTASIKDYYYQSIELSASLRF